MTIGVMINGGQAESAKPITTRQADDFYPTPADVGHSVMRWLSNRCLICHSTTAADLAAGDGALARVVAQYCAAPVAVADIVDRGCGATLRDFLHTRRRHVRGLQFGIFNPPFVLAEEFIRHAHHLHIPIIAMLLKSSYWHAASRRALWQDHRPYAVLPLLWRPDFMGLGAPVMEVAWNIWWTAGAPGPTIYEPLPKPEGPLFAAQAVEAAE